MAIHRGIVLTGGLLLGLASVGIAQPAHRTAAAATTADAVVGAGAAATPSASASLPTSGPEVLTYADEMPSFTGGDAAFHRYLAQKINYPAEANQRNLSGTVYVRFVVDEQGRIRDAEVAKGCGHGFDEEALRVIRLMPWWVPGRMAGQPVRVLRTMPIIFRLSH